MQLTDAQKQAIADLLEKEPQIVAAYLFGSQANGRAGLLSDIDLGVIFLSSVSENRRDALLRTLFAKLSIELKTDAIDLLDLRRASVLLRYRATFNSALLFTKDRVLTNRLAFESLQAYEDFKPYLAVQQRFIKQAFSV